jgi:O-methyltransferase
MGARRLLRRSALRAVLQLRRPQPELRPDRLYAYLDALWARRDTPGDVLEVGCFRGGTTRVAYRFLQLTQSSKRYVAVDTFAGFVDRQFEHDRRHGTLDRFRTGFSVNSIDAVRQSLEANGCGGVELIEGDITTVPDSALPSRIAVCLIDVDLEIPTYGSLCRVAARLEPGGIVLVDDCDPTDDYAGALVGYRRFVSERDFPEEYFMAMGVVRSPVR